MLYLFMQGNWHRSPAQVKKIIKLKFWDLQEINKEGLIVLSKSLKTSILWFE